MDREHPGGRMQRTRLHNKLSERRGFKYWQLQKPCWYLSCALNSDLSKNCFVAAEVDMTQ